MPQLLCKNLSLGYNSDVIIKDLSFSINTGDYLCIIGENGSGKSTLMKTVLGLQPKLDGTVIFEGGTDNNNIGYMPQQTPAQKDFPASVSEIVLSGCIKKGKLLQFYTKQDK